MRTKQSDEDIANLVLVLVIVITALMVAMSVVGIAAESYKSENQRFKSFLSEKYNFSKEECVDYNVSIHGEFIWNCPKGYVKDYTTGRWGSCIDERVGSGCSLYCHIRQVQEEECRIEEKTIETTRERNMSGFYCLFRNNVGEQLSSVFVRNDSLGEAYRECSTKSSGYIFFIIPTLEFKENIKEVYFFNQTVCTPKFRNETYGCQSGDDVRRVRELIG